MPKFNLGERDMTISVRNMSSDNPENTPFNVAKNKEVPEIYRGVYQINDIKEDLDGNEVNILFQNLHCKYNALINITPNNYVQNLTFRYKYDEGLNCKLDIEPKKFEKYIKVSIKKEDPIHDISLNDLYIWHFVVIFVFGVMLAITLGIRYIDKKGLLISKK